ncbi:thiolase [Bradyrhizobium sp. KB893862 SZCCT0404]|uniref:acetyl-CoA acetyltransferase n=1 Tax=Bradyrhizobium sp. KB893862 SZCCT0404 TaxID=2807672 RepID=UPI001BA897AD|nr:acetyl-CoA acetyltransferase [Bradyrhizobium sp. KB893862 SZCCT0404]MBR1177002.1 thiolase [Bradyrhizobium sp. KB893862 SZCCT0404]
MLDKTLRGSTAIVGVGTAGCGEAPSFSEIEILAEAAHAAVKDAGLTLQDIDGLCTANLNIAMWPLNVAEYLGIRPSFIEGTNIGGSAFVAHLQPAMLALAAGLCKAVLVCYGSTQRTATFGRKERTAARNLLDPAPFDTPYHPFNPPSGYALIAARHMHEFGTTRRHLAEVAVSARAWAQLNPQAFSRGPLSVEDVLGARMVSDPFSVYDCCLVTDGAGAFVLMRADAAKDRPQKPAYVLGVGNAAWHRTVSSMADLTVTPAQESGQRAYEMAGLQPSAIDMLQLYDAFTINPILFVEDLGFCKKGEGGPFLSSGVSRPGGKLPINTNGGGLSCVQPNMYGAFAVIEAVQQLRGTCGDRQVAGTNTVLVNGNGGNAASSQSTAILGSAATL